MTQNSSNGVFEQSFRLPIVAFFTFSLIPLPFLKGDDPAVFLHHQELLESSGVGVAAASGVVWSHNDSGDKPRLFAFNQQGKSLATFTARQTEAKDWEDLCCFSRNGRSFIAVGDVGDNLNRRESVQIYIFEEPSLPQQSQSPSAKTEKATKGKLDPVCKLNVTYRSGPVNCEALAYDPQRDSFILATKELFRCRLCEVPLTSSRIDEIRPTTKLPTLPRSASRVAVARQTLSLPLVTGGDIDSSGKQLALCTYGAGTMLFRQPTQTKWGHPAGMENAAFELPARKQGESICFAPTGEELLLTSEFAPCPLLRVPAPQTPAVKK